jgi:hypothetical protein
MLTVGFGLGSLLWSDEAELAPAAVAPTTTEATAAELPDDFPVEITVQFFDAAPPAHRQSVRREFEQSGLFDDFEFEYFGPLDDGPWNTITGSGHQDDDQAICAFGRQYLADPLVDGVVSRGTNECPDL